MRVKQIWDVIPLPAQIKLLWDRLTASRITTAYFIFSLCHCIIQVALQVHAFTINADAASLLWNLSVAANATNSTLIVADLQNDYLRLCPNVPSDLQDPARDCKIVWTANATGSSTLSSSYGAAKSLSSTPLSSLPIPSSSSATESSQSSESLTATGASLAALASTAVDRTTTTVFVLAVPTSVVDAVSEEDDDDLEDLLNTREVIEVMTVNPNHTASVLISGTQETLSQSCLWSLYWPVSVLDNTKREDIVFIGFQFWVLGMSIVALLNESIPHIFASLATHVLATGWSSYQILNTANFRSTFNHVITDGACDGVSLLPTYWDERAKAEYPTLALNILALLVSAFLTWRLIKLFGWQTFKRVGASLTINRVYKLVLSLSIVLQLSFFFTAATISLWIDNLINGVAAEVVWYNAFYKAVAIVVGVFLIPWLLAGWVAIRKESRILMFAFLLTSVLYIAGLSLMFLSTTFRWTFLHWHFFSVITSLSVFLTVSAFLIGIVCRYNFGKGLVRYLNAQEPLPGDDFAPVTPNTDIEKVAFPSEKVVPTFSATFGSGDEVPPPRQMFASRMGPRFFNRSAVPFEMPTDVTVPQPALSRAPSDGSDSSFAKQVTVVRNNTQTSIGSFDSYYNYSSSSEGGHHRMQSEDSTHTMNGRRWVIE
ncbi:hypothetical protein BDZ89DRAFT_1069885 [Hymenopellis radicata]|nr:hypothetical protein BDZ89DRAFT_1069885 [Hymenopellis radicata]